MKVKVILFITILFLFSTSALANTTLVNKKRKNLSDDESVSVTFTTKEKMIFQVPLYVECDMVEEGTIKIQLFNEKGDMIQNDSLSYKALSEDDEYETWFYSDGFWQKPGKYTYKIINNFDDQIDIKFSVLGHKSICNKISFNDNTIKGDAWNLIGTANNMPYIKSMTSSNTKVVKNNYYDITYDGKIYILTNKPGKTTLSFTLYNGKKVKKKIEVTNPDPNFYAQTVSYDTRNNRIKIQVENNGNKKVIIKPNAVLYSYDYKEYDRKLERSGSVSIPAHKSKTFYFNISGGYTWSDIKRFYLEFEFKYYGETFTGRMKTDNSFSRFKANNGKWYYTYRE